MHHYYIINIFLISFLLIFTGGCQIEDDEPELHRPRAVIEGILSSGRYPNVLFSSSIVPEIEGNISGAMINWGKVTISDGENTYILLGALDTLYLPPFRYYSYELKGEPGKTYKLTADFIDLYAESSVYLPFPTPIDKIELATTEVDSLRSALLHFTSPADTPAYYYVTLRSAESRNPPRICSFGTICADKPSEHYTLPLLKPKRNMLDTKYESQFIVGEEWIVSLNRVEKEVYEFWKAYDNMILFSQSPFISSDESLPTNISGGFGIWSPQGSSEYSLTIE